MSSLTLYIIRHGQTDWNARGIIQGRTNTRLNALGREQAGRNGEVLADILVNADDFGFVSSPLDRACETMEIIRKKLGLPTKNYKTDDRLLEVNYGDWQKHSWEELRKEKSKEIEERFADPWGTIAPGGESYEQAMLRVNSWLNEIGKNIVAVTHGGVMRCIRGQILNEATALRPTFDVPHDRILLLQDNRIEWI